MASSTASKHEHNCTHEHDHTHDHEHKQSSEGSRDTKPRPEELQTRDSNGPKETKTSRRERLIQMNAYLQDHPNEYGNGRAFGRTTLERFSRHSIPDDYNGEVYIPSSWHLDIPKQCTNAFVLGLIEPSLRFHSHSIDFSLRVTMVPSIETWLTKNQIEWTSEPGTEKTIRKYTLKGVHMIDCLGLLYDSSTVATRDIKKYEQYLKLIQVGPLSSSCCSNAQDIRYELPMLCVISKDPKACAPAKLRVSDVGYELTLIQKSGPNVYDTGLIIRPPTGFYLELVPSPTLITEHGYLGCHTILDPKDETNTIKLTLIKLNSTFPDLPLPCVGLRLLLRQIHHAGLTYQ